jgi:hypothetical protein
MAEANGAKRRAAPSQLKATRAPFNLEWNANARAPASRTVGASAASTRAAPSQLTAIRSTASRTAGASAARSKAASSPLKAIRSTASRTAEAGGVSTWAAPRQLLVAAHYTARRTVVAGGVRRRAALRQSLRLQAARSARCVSGASSPTLRRTMRRSSVGAHRCILNRSGKQTTSLVSNQPLLCLEQTRGLLLLRQQPCVYLPRDPESSLVPCDGGASLHLPCACHRHSPPPLGVLDSLRTGLPLA